MKGKEYVGSDELYADVQRTMRLCAEMNSGYHTEAEVRDCLREITRSEVPDTVRVFTPLNINYGPGVRFGDDCFLNFGCTLLAIGGITIGDGAFIGPHCVLATEYHPEDPATRHTLLTKPIVIGQHVTIMPGVHIGDGAIIGANTVVASDIPPYAVAVGNPCRVVKMRFDDEFIAYLLKLKWWDWDIEKIEANFEALSSNDLSLIKKIKI
ncbi:MAG: sugar O-acetyltransferase [Bacteroidales bacterium]|nr:sugar O-acetyltransferase [Bacteroidales bacterium]